MPSLRTVRPRALLAASVAALVLAAPGLAPAPAGAQSAQPAPAQAPAPATRPAPRPADVASVDAIITALYAVISGPAGQAREWDRLHSLFHPTARMMPIGRRPDGSFAINILSTADYVQRSGEMLTRYGFTEKEIARKTERFGNLVHVWSTYEGTFSAPDAPRREPLRGINSIQLANDGARWWIMSISWEAERPDSQLPAQYLPGAR